MRNRVVGFLVIGIALLIGFIIFAFNQAMTTIVNTSCSHGTSCPMWGTIEFQTNMSLAIMVFVIAIGLYLVFFGQEDKIITKFKTIKQQIEPKKITKENYRKVMESLDSDERAVLEKIINSKGTIFQSDLVNNDRFNKVKVTRILDRLEGRGLVERRRRGMTNVIVLK
jgi:uncharacterized membrane protein